ncbi:helix-turn-helix domain-containing protein [Enterococcus rivorum]|uniref:Fis family transcriptional regulator n=1 Tax=Enterococcus rivorum TaxID=762845 RepID=A0A1E5KXN6_9ENTE|nr:helix-turn-helix domain-containing protein [Enterococcus rivorum]MBP2099764.1 sugar diacid utilization regulator [Enterococcus rivorum]OEH82651.1 Fis family transcriptional regulator [Enterococcus rivorum]
MTIEELLEIYPTGFISESKAAGDFLSLPVDNRYFILSKEILQKTEIALLSKMFTKKNGHISIERHPWYGYLFKQVDIDIDGSFRIIHFQLQKPIDFMEKEWQNSIKEMFPLSVDFFFLTENEGLLVEPYSKSHYSLDELEGIFLTLDTDFDSSTIAFIGKFFSTKDEFIKLFHEEQQIFHEELSYIKGKSAFSLTDVALHYFTKESLKKSSLVQNFSKQLTLNDDMKEIIHALWHNQGNISSTAKALFMHRNTLQYRLEKFYEQTGLSLKKMDDLIFCYLLISK